MSIICRFYQPMPLARRYRAPGIHARCAILLLVSAIWPLAVSGDDLFKRRADVFAQPDFLPVDEAFVVSAQRSGARAGVAFSVTPGHYLYRERMHFYVGGVKREVTLPVGETVDDPHFGITEVYRESIDVALDNPAEAPLEIVVYYQGCATAGLCYPPQKRLFSLPAGDESVHLAARAPGSQLPPVK